MAQAADRVQPRVPLNRERVLRAAINLADKEGIDALSMRKLGQELGVEAMSLYNHVANKEDLLDGIVDLVVDEIDPPLEGVDWKTALRARILSAREMLKRHPWASKVLESRAVPTPKVLDYMESMLAILRSGGFSIDLTHHAMHAMGSRLFGFAQELYDDSAELDPEMEAMLEQMAAQYPNIAELALKIQHDEASIVGSGCDDQVEFEFSLDLILDGLERLHAAEN